VLVNGKPVAKKNIKADGELRDVAFEVDIPRSSWVALRILPSSHSNPVWVLTGDKPFVPERRSVEWCLQSVDQCWSQKRDFIKSAEMKEAESAYEHARQTYRKILAAAN
jgi:hypothetical protein